MSALTDVYPPLLASAISGWQEDSDACSVGLDRFFESTGAFGCQEVRSTQRP
jgi:hypothetical protein